MEVKDQKISLGESCATCKWRNKTACTVNPPVPMFMPRENPLTRAVNTVLVGVYPPVQDDTLSCRFYEHKMSLQ
jgi:hypothetical protein